MLNTKGFKECFITWLVVFTTALLITSLALDSQGRKPWNHVESLPSQVNQLNESNYLLTPGAKLTPEQICGADSKNESNVQIDKTVAKLHDIRFVSCFEKISWNDHRAQSINLGHALLRTLGNYWFEAPLGLFFLLLLGWFWAPEENRLQKLQQEREARERARLQEKKVTFETKSNALATAFAQGTIDVQEFESALDRLL